MSQSFSFSQSNITEKFKEYVKYRWGRKIFATFCNCTLWFKKIHQASTLVATHKIANASMWRFTVPKITGIEPELLELYKM